MFSFGVGFVVEDLSKRVLENGHSLIETDILFSKVALGFGGDPLKFHGYILLRFFHKSALVIEVDGDVHDLQKKEEEERRVTQAQSLWKLALFIQAGLSHGQKLRELMTP